MLRPTSQQSISPTIAEASRGKYSGTREKCSYIVYVPAFIICVQGDPGGEGGGHLLMGKEGSCGKLLEALPEIRATSTNRMGTASWFQIAHLSLLALMALLTSSAHTCCPNKAAP